MDYSAATGRAGRLAMDEFRRLTIKFMARIR